MEQGIRFPYVIWITKLADQIGSAQQQSFLFDEVVDLIVRWGVRKTRIFDGPGNSSRVDFFHVIEPLNDEQL